MYLQQSFWLLKRMTNCILLPVDSTCTRVHVYGRSPTTCMYVPHMYKLHVRVTSHVPVTSKFSQYRFAAFDFPFRLKIN